MRRIPLNGRWLLLASLVLHGCRTNSAPAEFTPSEVSSEIERLVHQFEDANTSLDPDQTVSMLWPEFQMRVDDRWTTYQDLADGSRDYMAALASLHTVWSDLRVVPLSNEYAIASFSFRDSIVANDGTVRLSQGPTSLVWENRQGVWKMIFGDADHYPVGETR